VSRDKTTDTAAAARVICLRLLTAQPRSRAELAAALQRKGIPEDISETMLDRLDDVGLVDDAAVAEAAVHSGHTYRGLGRRALGAELRRRGVPEEIARDAVAAIEPQDEERRARELVQRKLSSTTAPDEAVVRRMVGMLARKGYPEGLAFRVVRGEVRAMTGVDPSMPDPG
jgi:regulatory protein